MSSPPVYGDPNTRRRLLEAALELLEDEGPTFTLADVARRTGVSRQAVYLHFGDRAGLLVALVDHVDLSRGSADVRAYIFGGESGTETLRRWVETMSWYSAKIDRVAWALESAQYDDEAASAGWRNRMGRRQALLLGIVERIGAEGRLAEPWTPMQAAELIYTLTMPGPWRELTRELRWSQAEYAERLWTVIERSFLTPAR